MSITMYAYKIKRRDFWPFMGTIRTLYREKHPAFGLKLKEDALPKDSTDALAIVDNAMKMFRGYGGTIGSEVELFELNDKQYLFRVLERTYFFLEQLKLHEAEWPITKCYYDDTGELLEELIPNLDTAKWMNEQVAEQKYFITPIFNLDNLLEFYMNKWVIAEPWLNAK